MNGEMKSKKRLEPFDYVVLILATAAGIITLYPMWYVIALSVSDPAAVAANQVHFWPVGFYTGSYSVIIEDSRFWITLRNSIFYVVIGTVLMEVTTLLMAYPLTRSNMKGRKWVVMFLLIPMYFAGGMIPSFILITKLGLYNTVWATILPGSYSIWNIILCKTFLQSIPKELAEAAYIDGANNRQALTKIYLPLSKPVLAVIAIYTIVGIWNSWFNAKLYQTKIEIQPIQLYLQQILIEQSVDITELMKMHVDKETMDAMLKKSLTARQLKYAMIVVVTLPILMVYPMFQKHFVKGVMLGSLKG